MSRRGFTLPFIVNRSRCGSLPPTGTGSSGCQSTTLCEPVGRHVLRDAGDLHGSARYHGRQRLDSAHCRQSGFDQRGRYVGSHVVPGFERHCVADFRLAGKPHGPEAVAADLRRRVHGDVAVLWPGHFAYAVDCFSRAARADGRRTATAGPGDSSGNFSQGTAWSCHGGFWHRHSAGTDSGAYVGRMDHRQLFLALDLLSEPADRRLFLCS